MFCLLALVCAEVSVSTLGHTTGVGERRNKLVYLYALPSCSFCCRPVRRRPICATQASPNAAVETNRAPCTPSLFILRKTLTTIRFRGTPKMFMSTERCVSGRYFERNVPMVGKYMPTHASKRKKAATSTPRLCCW
eukprot:scaffold733_cov267-Pinguiococcus_pyrenoidosus.AAC.30